MPGDKREAAFFRYDRMKERLLEIPDALDRLLCMVTYANGNRIGETIRLTYADFVWTPTFLRIKSPVLKKRGSKERRNCPIHRKIESWLTEPIIDYIDSERLAPEDSRKIWKKSKRTAQTRINKWLGCISHSLRHSRASHLMQEYGYSFPDLKAYFSLADKTLADWAMRYGHLEKSHLELKWAARYKELETKPSN